MPSSSRPLLRLFAAALGLALLAALLPSALAAAQRSGDTHVDLWPARALAIPRVFFPTDAVVRARSAGNALADRLDDAQTTGFAQLKRVNGYVQTAHWTERHRGWRPRSYAVQYLASSFATADDAAAATSDAQASLWEYGHAITLPGWTTPAFLVMNRRQFRVELAFGGGPLSLTIRLVSRQAPSPGALLRLTRIVRGAARQRSHLLRGLPFALRVPDNGAEPATFVAPFGAGPVIESPTLLAMDATDAPAGAALSPLLTRGPRPSLAGGARLHPALALPGALARDIRIAYLPGGRVLIHSDSLFFSPAAAAFTLRRLALANQAAGGRAESIPPPAGRLALANALHAWRFGSETVLLLRFGNVIFSLGATHLSLGALLSVDNRLLARTPTWLHAQGTQLVNAFGDPVSLAGLNWYGFDQQDFVAGGLDFRPYLAILQSIKHLGYTCLRLPFSDQLVTQNPVVTEHLAANPELRGLHALDIMDRIVAAAGALGLVVILDNHRSEAGWSSEPSGLWYTLDYPESAFLADWSTLAQRYAGVNAVVGADLRNEPHAAATWGDGNPATDWHAAAERAGNLVLAQNPHLLVIVEGVQYFHGSNSYWWGGNLMGVATAPVMLHFPDGLSAHSQLVYSAHDYGKDNCGIGCPWFSSSTTYASLTQVWDQYWGYIFEDPTASYAAPVWLGEFGTCNFNATCVSDQTPGSQGQWFSSLMRYIADHNLNWAYWSVNGTESTAGTRVYGDLDWYGLFDSTWQTPQPFLTQMLRTAQPGFESATPRSPGPRG